LTGRRGGRMSIERYEPAPRSQPHYDDGELPEPPAEGDEDWEVDFEMDEL
jgi:hypothetical protein